MIEQNSKLAHPEADLLVAFAEQSLTAHERESLLMHLADCAECRELLFLAQEGLPEESLSPLVFPAKESRTTWFTWRTITVAACLLLTVSVLTVQIYQRSRSSKETVAKLTPVPVVPQANDNLVKNTSVPPTATKQALVSQASATQAPSASDKAVPSTHAPALTTGVSHNLSNAPEFVEPYASKTATARNFTMAAPSQSFKGDQQQAFKVEPQKTRAESIATLDHSEEKQDQFSLERKKSLRESSLASSAQMADRHSAGRSAPTATAAYDASGSSSGSSSGGSMIAAPQLDGAVSQTVTVSAASPIQISTQSQINSLTTLPDGKQAQTSVTIAGKLLALDQNGRLYASTNQGKKWREIHKQWIGTATMLMIAPKSTDDVEELDRNAGQTSGESVLLRNATNQEWISKDLGESWKPYKPLVMLDQSAPQKPE